MRTGTGECQISLLAPGTEEHLSSALTLDEPRVSSSGESDLFGKPEQLKDKDAGHLRECSRPATVRLGPRTWAIYSQ
jgi:hypothetical protein